MIRMDKFTGQKWLKLIKWRSRWFVAGSWTSLQSADINSHYVSQNKEETEKSFTWFTTGKHHIPSYTYRLPWSQICLW